ncbi:MAG: hypothetical protein H0X33_13275 [Taibaiella sp.]|nr:hypothetical protein [Taibaiella sp.]
MKRMVSGISTIALPEKLAAQSSFKRNEGEKAGYAAPSIGLSGMPGEYDFRKFITQIFEGIRPVQIGAGGITVGSLAVTTNKDNWKSETPKYVNGLLGAVKQPTDNSTWYTDLELLNDGLVGISTKDDGTLPSKAVATNRTTATTFSVRLIQDTSK